MGWASQHIDQLRAGRVVQFRPKGHSMRGKVESGQLVTVVPMGVAPQSVYPDEGDIVLCKVRGREYLHLVKAVGSEGDRPKFLIGNNRGGINGWVGANAIYGRCVKVEP